MNLDDEVMERLRMAAEEIAFLGGRGYDLGEAKALVGKQRRLTAEHQALLDRAVCSVPQYKGRAVKEMLPEDISRHPLLVDGHDVMDAITTALAGLPLLEGLDQTVQPLAPGGSAEHVDAAIERIGPILREMRPSKTKWLLDEKRPDAPALKETLLGASKKWKTPVEVEIMPDPKPTLRKAPNVATSDPAIIDACRGWCNLSGPVVATLTGVIKIKLQ